MRDVDIALKKIQIRRHNAFALRASLHGYKIPLKGIEPPKSNLKPINDSAADAVMRAALERKRKEIGGQP